MVCHKKNPENTFVVVTDKKAKSKKLSSTSLLCMHVHGFMRKIIRTLDLECTVLS